MGNIRRVFSGNTSVGFLVIMIILLILIEICYIY